MTKSHSSRRVSQIDVLRALAIGVVMIHHYRETRFFLSGFGATLFFVLSGFFATKTLLGLRTSAEARQITKPGALQTFYLQRWLRLCPLYYLILVVTLILNVDNARSSFIWNSLFLSNVQVMVTGNWSGRFSPLWSLSVLEQFYLIWPALILFCPKQRLLPAVVAVIALAPLYRLRSLFLNAPTVYWCVVPLASLDQLGVGALLALCGQSLVSGAVRDRIFWIAGRICVPAFLVLLAGKYFQIEAPMSAIYINLVASLAFLWLIHCTSTGFSGLTKKFMEMKFLGHIGRLSYSVYLLHDFTELLIPKTVFFRHILDSGYKPFLLIPLTILIAHFSWCIIERPFHLFRRRYIPAFPTDGLAAIGSHTLARIN